MRFHRIAPLLGILLLLAIGCSPPSNFDKMEIALISPGSVAYDGQVRPLGDLSSGWVTQDGVAYWLMEGVYDPDTCSDTTYIGVVLAMKVTLDDHGQPMQVSDIQGFISGYPSIWYSFTMDGISGVMWPNSQRYGYCAGPLLLTDEAAGVGEANAQFYQEPELAGNYESLVIEHAWGYFALPVAPADADDGEAILAKHSLMIEDGRLKPSLDSRDGIVSPWKGTP